MESYEKLGRFYLGRRYDLEARKVEDALVLYDSKDLSTHAFCVGMTGSGKTGLCVGLLEEAAIDGIPSLVIDPKGDLANLMLTFPELRPEDFLPWVNPDDARRRGRSVEEYAADQAELWREGLASWDQSPERIRRLRDAADFAVYTPGSEAGLPVSIVSSFQAPPPAVRDDGELFRDRIVGTVTSLLSLLRIEADPLQSREHILLSNILESAWTRGQDLDLASLIRSIQSPPMSRVGVFELEAFFPADDRFALAMKLNNLLAAPGFDTWLKGDPLDVDRLLYAADGRPRVAIFSIAHLSETERMFFVSLLLNQTLAWMRSRSGTTSLRALLYMDEIAGYIPPVAEPPSKKPFLTLLKQGRAFGVGVMLASQNPVDLDYKGLSNAGTWFLGRLQTERDKLRVLDGLEGVAAAGGFDRERMDRVLSRLGSRVFLMHNVHEDEPVVFHTRWVMSYLRGPLTRDQIRALTHERAGGEDDVPRGAATGVSGRAGTGGRAEGSGAAVAGGGAEDTITGQPTPREAPGGTPTGPGETRRAAGTVGAPAGGGPGGAGGPAGTDALRPSLPPDVPQAFVPVWGVAPDGARLVYEPRVLGLASIHYEDRKTGLEHDEEVGLLAVPDGSGLEWRDAEETRLRKDDLGSEPAGAASWAPVPEAAVKERSYRGWERDLVDALYRTRRLPVLRSPTTGELSGPGEDARAFRIRLSDRFRELRDLEAEKLRTRYAGKIATLEDRVRRADLAVDRERDQARQHGFQTAVSVGASLLGAVLGRKGVGLGRVTTAVRGAGRARRQMGDVERAEESLEALQARLADLQAEFEAEVDALEGRLDPLAEELETVELKPLKRNVEARLVTLAWVPFFVGADGRREPARPP